MEEPRLLAGGVLTGAEAAGLDVSITCEHEGHRTCLPASEFGTESCLPQGQLILNAGMAMAFCKDLGLWFCFDDFSPNHESNAASDWMTVTIRTTVRIIGRIPALAQKSVDSHDLADWVSLSDLNQGFVILRLLKAP